MASSRIYVFTHFALNDNGENDLAIKAAVHTPSAVDWTGMASPEIVVEGTPEIGLGFYRNANEYPTLSAAACPSVAPATCRHYLLAYKVQGGDDDNYVTDYHEALGAAGLSNLLDWLAVWFPDIRNAVAPLLTAASTHLEAAQACARAINPNAVTLT